MTAQCIFGGHRLRVETGGHVSFSVQRTNSPHRHDYFEICLVLSGKGEYRHGAQRFMVQPGDVFLAEPGVVHEITSFVTRDLRLFFVSLSLSSLPGEAHSDEARVAMSFARARRVASSGHAALAAYVPILESPENHAVFAAESVLVSFALELMNALCSEPVTSQGAEPGDDAARALAFIDGKLPQGVTVEETAAALGLSERTLRRRFREKHGTTLVEEINHRRMRQAAHKLLMGFAVAEVAESIGIASPAQFTRAFKRAFGIPPKKFQSTYAPGDLGQITRPAEAFQTPGQT